ncbi:hypothetical protein SAMN06265368_3491 [Cohaesibacter gelatinilyticus]|uniref:Uncharacterized protein n=1 Tax=Cohaesibacter gelatinilyticus TaxID=372072 RepID=A0A285PG15_9HYPH|nr:hypothetical protein SAMN06265368_3491 [Cohaesibacter gelatinilyticus]
MHNLGNAMALFLFDPKKRSLRFDPNVVFEPIEDANKA